MDHQQHGDSAPEAGVAPNQTGGNGKNGLAPDPVPAEPSPHSMAWDPSLMSQQYGTYSDNSTGNYSSTLGTDDYRYLIPEDTAKVAAAQDIVTDDTGKEVDNAVNYDTGKELNMMHDLDTAKEILPPEWQTAQNAELEAEDAKRRKKRRKWWIVAGVVSTAIIGIIVGVTVGLLANRRNG
jgi:hypothetical protein